jgi:PTS system galactitol-specific IIB component
MSKYRLHVLCVCGSGIVTSSMLLVRVQDIFDEEKISCTVDTTSPYEMESIIASRPVDLIISTTPLTEMKNVKCPIILGHALLSGHGEDEVIEEIRSLGRKILDEHENAK